MWQGCQACLGLASDPCGTTIHKLGLVWASREAELVGRASTIDVGQLHLLNISWSLSYTFFCRTMLLFVAPKSLALLIYEQQPWIPSQHLA
jgi:hypothetical protein